MDSKHCNPDKVWFRKIIGQARPHFSSAIITSLERDTWSSLAFHATS